MKRTIAVILISLLVAPPASARQKPVEWQQVQKLSAGAEIVLTLVGGQPAKVRLLFADDVTLVTLKATAPNLPKDFLVGLARYWNDIVDRRAIYTWGNLRASPEGLFDGDKKLADLMDLVQQTPRVEVLTVVVQRSWWSRNWWWVVPVVFVGYLALGAFFGAMSAS